ncbi:electron transfer flavoprotein subunit alpha/FixB family protein [Zavarzinia sp.]|uniref:electron transfer flavoprotein subunit alpha/FixB family protein n=1 Tax=Zavarzinia sp. TaxID=2027920 RepID=UPI003566A1C5
MTGKRRDPRAERDARRVAGGERPRFALTPAATGLRRDPRAERDRVTVAGERRRLVRDGAGGAAPAPVAAPVVRVVVEEPAFLVLAVPEAVRGALSAHDRQLLGAARLLAEAGGAVAVFAGVDGPAAGAAGADRLIADDLTGYDPEARAARLAALAAQLSPRHILLPETASGGDLARRLAALTGETLFAGAERVTADLVTRPARARRVEQRCRPPRLITLAADRVPAYGGPPREARPLAATLPAGGTGRFLSVEEIAPDPAAVPLGEAGFVVAAGNGVRDFATFRALAAALGATPGASRAVCDAGAMPRAAQVGASGTVLRADCYLAFGISGAPQHLAGIAATEQVIAVNTDLHAAMIERAGLAIVADAQAVMPALLAALKREKP